ncbi:monocyte chemotactic protein 1B-like isoform X2 [Myxocyprinus asiaticus]|uniref:monocyte chemotactic protein 1B-like isoform X2 n=1 Tax=Myxocyprinus asiaticus TaxID=70543 RepID=UPI0022215A9E|nr:monocyte chemotactic protein 1B-like isoform X2 [Myxocyprinus asiaticus]
MKSLLCCFTAVLLLWLLVFSIASQETIISTSCLTTTDTKVLQRLLHSYTIQRKPLFSVKAVRFRTIKGTTICSDPSSPWAIKSMKYLDGKMKSRKGSNTTARHSITMVPVHLTTTNMTSAQI